MAAITFDTLSVARRLKQAGMSAELAEAQAEIMAETFVHNADALVTRDYLDARFGEFEARVDARFGEFEARVDARFGEFEARVDARFAESAARVDARFAEFEARMDARFTDMEVGTNARFASIDLRFAQIDGKFRLLYWMQALIIASTVLPAISKLLL